MFKYRNYVRFFSSPLFRFGIPTVGGVLLGTVFVTELIKINRLLRNKPTGISEEELVDKFDINEELKVCSRLASIQNTKSEKVGKNHFQIVLSLLLF